MNHLIWISTVCKFRLIVFGTFKVLTWYILFILVPPSFVVVPQLQEVLLNSRLVLRCTANGIPTPNIYWKHNDVVVPCEYLHMIKQFRLCHKEKCPSHAVPVHKLFEAISDGSESMFIS